MRKFLSRPRNIALVLLAAALLGGCLYWQSPAQQLARMPTSPPAFDKPASTDLELWILDPQPRQAWFDGHIQQWGFGPMPIYGAGYEQGSTACIQYSFGHWPDRKSPCSYLTLITVTDPAVNILNGLTLRSTEQEWAAGLEAFGLEVELRCQYTGPDQRELIYMHPDALYGIRVLWHRDQVKCAIFAPTTNVTDYNVVY